MKLRPRRDTSRGSAAVEFALVLPLFATLVFGVIEYGWFFFQQFGVASAVREGARTGCTVAVDDSPDPRSVAVTRARAVLTGVGISVVGGSVTAGYSGVSPTRLLTVDVDIPYKPLVNFVPAPTRLHYAMTMMLELQ